MATARSQKFIDLWRDRITRFHKSGQPLGVWCREQGIKLNKYYYWKKKLERESACLKKQDFVEIPHTPQVGACSTKITVECGSLLIHLQGDFDPEIFNQVLQNLRSVSC